MKTPNNHSLVLAVAITLGAVLAIAGVALAFGNHAEAPAQPQSPMSVPF
jgi:hypothetical protein